MKTLTSVIYILAFSFSFNLLFETPVLAQQQQMLIPGYLCGNGNMDDSCFYNRDSWMQPNGGGALIGSGLLRFQVPYIHPYTYNPYYNNPTYGRGSYFNGAPNAWYYMPRNNYGSSRGRGGLFSGSYKKNRGSLFSGSGGSSSRSSSSSSSSSTSTDAKRIDNTKTNDIGRKQIPAVAASKAKEANSDSSKKFECGEGYRVNKAKTSCEVSCYIVRVEFVQRDENWNQACSSAKRKCEPYERPIGDSWGGGNCESETQGNYVSCPEVGCGKKTEEILTTAKNVEDITDKIKNPFVDDTCDGKERIDDTILSDAARKFIEIKDPKVQEMAVCVAASRAIGNLNSESRKSCDASGKIGPAKIICNTEAYASLVAHSINASAKCMKLDPKDLFTIMNHESKLNSNAAEKLGSFGLGQNNFVVAKDLFEHQLSLGNKKIGYSKLINTATLSKADQNEDWKRDKDCLAVSDDLDQLELSYRKGASTFACDILDPKKGIRLSSTLTAAYYKLLTIDYVDSKIVQHNSKNRNFPEWDSNKCPYGPLVKNKNLLAAAKSSIKNLSYNAGPGGGNIVLCDYMRYLGKNGGVVEEKFFTDPEDPKSLQSYLTKINKISDKENSKEFKEFAGRIHYNKYKAKDGSKALTANYQGADRIVALDYLGNLNKDIDIVSNKVKAEYKFSCGNNPYSGAAK